MKSCRNSSTVTTPAKLTACDSAQAVSFDPINPPPHACRLRAGPVPVATRGEYQDRYLRACGSMFVCVMIITPAEARYILNRFNDHNRHLSAAWRKISAAIKHGGWMITGETIVFDRSGRLVDGQHRLQAIAESEEPVAVLVVYGVEEEKFQASGQTKPRGASDVLSIDKNTHCTTLAGALGWQMKYDAGQIDKTYDLAVPNDIVLQLAADHPGLIASVSYACCEGRQKLIPPSLTAFLHYQFWLRDPDATQRFFDRVARGINVECPSHEFILRRYLDSKVSMRRAVDQVEIAACVVKTWNRVRSNEATPSERSVVKWNGNIEKFPEIK